MPAERDSPACRPPGRRLPGPLHPGSGIRSGPRPQSSPFTKALGGVEPKSHFLPVSHTRRKTAVTGTGKADPAGLLGKAMGPQRAGHRDPCPSLPSMHAWARAGYVHRPPLQTFPGYWVGVPSGPPTGRPWGRFRSLPLHPRASAKAGSQTSSWCTSSTVRASALMVVLLILYAPPPAVPHSSLVIDPAQHRTHPPISDAPGSRPAVR